MTHLWWAWAAAAATTLALPACGHCEGALREMRASPLGGHSIRDEDPHRQPTSIAPGEHFVLIADGPAEGDLLAGAQINADNWFVLNDATGAHVAAKIDVRPGGHSCKNGVLFEMTPDAPLAAGSYTLVLWLAAVRWPLVEDEERRAFQGKAAMVRRYRVGGQLADGTKP